MVRLKTFSEQISVNIYGYKTRKAFLMELKLKNLYIGGEKN
jgi:hypothetical protein